MNTNEMNIQWLIRRHIPEVMRIEQESFENPWSEEELLCYLRQRNCIGMIIQYNYEILGFVFYELCKSKLRIVKIAIDPQHRRKGVGKTIIARLVDKLSQQRRREIQLEVRESNLSGQLFFKSLGFVATSVIRNAYDDTMEDCYIMRYSICSHEYSYSNRLKAYSI